MEVLVRNYQGFSHVETAKSAITGHKTYLVLLGDDTHCC